MKISIVAFDDLHRRFIYFLWDLLDVLTNRTGRVRLLDDKPTPSSTGIEMKMHGRLDETNPFRTPLTVCSGQNAPEDSAQEFLDSFV